MSQFGSLDVLVNNAGIGSSSFQIHEEPVELWDRTIDVNLKGVFLGTRTAVPAMLEAGGGSIINISSQLGIVGVPYNGSAYQTSKGRRAHLHQGRGVAVREPGHPCQLGASRALSSQR